MKEGFTWFPEELPNTEEMEEGCYFGHFHVDEKVEDVFFCMYDEVVEL